MKKLIQDFKKFISRGNVMDLAVGMIIGAAFTAIVTALVTGILKPLINLIPGADGTSALQTVLKNPVVDANGVVIKEAVILDWGAVISAIITFICTALLLFFIVKAFNSMKAKSEKVKDKVTKKGKKVDETAETPAEEVKEEVKEEPAEPTQTELLLAQILEQLKKNSGEKTEE